MLSGVPRYFLAVIYHVRQTHYTLASTTKIVQYLMWLSQHRHNHNTLISILGFVIPCNVITSFITGPNIYILFVTQWDNLIRKQKKKPVSPQVLLL